MRHVSRSKVDKKPIHKTLRKMMENQPERFISKMTELERQLMPSVREKEAAARLELAAAGVGSVPAVAGEAETAVLDDGADRVGGQIDRLLTEWGVR